MSWNLFLDDLRDPSYVNDGREYVIARTAAEAVDLVLKKGFPSHISFDHDLGWDLLTPDSETGIIVDMGRPAKSGYDFVQWIVNADMDGHIHIPEDFTYYVHSANPVGKANIEGLLESYFRSKRSS